MTATLKMIPEGFLRKKGFQAAGIKWHDVQEIVGVHFPKATYDENFLIVTGGGKTVEAGELDKHFVDFERVLLEKLPDFPTDWRTRVEAAGANSRIRLWTRN